jgi:hypothetical protein
MQNGGLVHRLSNIETEVLDQRAKLLDHDRKLDEVFEVDLATYNAQYADCPLEILPSYGVHDRFLFIDDAAYHFGASLKDLDKNTFFFTKEEFTLEEVLKKRQKNDFS